VHISTDDTFMVDAIKIKGNCPVCCKRNQSLTLGWLQEKCNTCGNYFSMENLGEIVEKRRKLLGLTRKEMGKKMGLSRATIAQYEIRHPSEIYWYKTEVLMNNYNRRK